MNKIEFEVEMRNLEDRIEALEAAVFGNSERTEPREKSSQSDIVVYRNDRSYPYSES